MRNNHSIGVIMHFKSYVKKTSGGMELVIPYHLLKRDNISQVDALCRYISHYNKKHKRKIVKLIAACNQLNDEDIGKIARIKELKYLDVTHNNITPVGARSIANCPHISYLEIGNNPLLGDEGAKLLSQPPLISLFLDECNITDDSSHLLSQNLTLKVLKLSGNMNITNKTALAFASIKRDMIVDLRDTSVTEKCKRVLLTKNPMEMALLDYETNKTADNHYKQPVPSLLALSFFTIKNHLQAGIDELIPDIKDTFIHDTVTLM